MEAMKSVLDSESQICSGKIIFGKKRVNFQVLHAFQFVCLKILLKGNVRC